MEARGEATISYIESGEVERVGMKNADILTSEVSPDRARAEVHLKESSKNETRRRM